MRSLQVRALRVRLLQHLAADRSGAVPDVAALADCASRARRPATVSALPAWTTHHPERSGGKRSAGSRSVFLSVTMRRPSRWLPRCSRAAARIERLCMPPSSSDTIQCIYCRQNAPPSREHVLQRALGGNLILRDVCSPCNTSFSAIDQNLSDHSIISLTRILDTPDSKKVQAGTTHLIFDPASQCYLEVRLRNAFTPQLVPQLHRKIDGTFLFTAADAHGRDEKSFMRLFSVRR